MNITELRKLVKMNSLPTPTPAKKTNFTTTVLTTAKQQEHNITCICNFCLKKNGERKRLCKSKTGCFSAVRYDTKSGEITDRRYGCLLDKGAEEVNLNIIC